MLDDFRRMNDAHPATGQIQPLLETFRFERGLIADQIEVLQFRVETQRVHRTPNIDGRA